VGENRNVYSVLVELKNKGAFGRPRYTLWEIILKLIVIKTNSFQFLVQHIKEDRILLFCIHFTRKKLEIYYSMFHHSNTTTQT
jgi:hypothetical protein